MDSNLPAVKVLCRIHEDAKTFAEYEIKVPETSEMENALRSILPNFAAERKQKETKLKGVDASLQSTLIEVVSMRDKIDYLLARLDEALGSADTLADKLDALREKREESQTRRDRGQKLVSGLESESKRIVLEIEKVRREEVNDAGDAILAAAFVTTLGSASAHVRTVFLDKWRAMLNEEKIAHSETFVLPARIESGLPASFLKPESSADASRKKELEASVLDILSQEQHLLARPDALQRLDAARREIAEIAAKA